jgi:hypothetical protein
VKLILKLMKKQGFAPDVLVTDGLRSCRAAKAGFNRASNRTAITTTLRA